MFVASCEGSGHQSLAFLVSNLVINDAKLIFDLEFLGSTGYQAKYQAGYQAAFDTKLNLFITKQQINY